MTLVVALLLVSAACHLAVGILAARMLIRYRKAPCSHYHTLDIAHVEESDGIVVLVLECRRCDYRVAFDLKTGEAP